MIGRGDSGILGDGGKEKESRKQVQGAGRPKESEGARGLDCMSMKLVLSFYSERQVCPKKGLKSDSGIKGDWWYLGCIEGGMKTVPFWGTEVGVVSFCVVVLLNR